MTPLLAQAIEAFRGTFFGEVSSDPDAAEGICGFFSGAFIEHLDKIGFFAYPVQMAGVTGRDLPVFPRTKPDELLTHSVVLVEDGDGDHVIDWTARQYDPAAD